MDWLSICLFLYGLEIVATTVIIFVTSNDRSLRSLCSAAGLAVALPFIITVTIIVAVVFTLVVLISVFVSIVREMLRGVFAHYRLKSLEDEDGEV